MTVITSLLGYFLIGVVLVSLGYVIQSFQGKTKLHSLRILLMVIYFELWTVSRIVMIFDTGMILITSANHYAILRIGNLCLMASILTLAFLFTNLFFGELARFFALIAYSLFSGLSVLILYDFFNPIFFRYLVIDHVVENDIHILPIILTIAGLVMLSLSYFKVMRSLDSLPEMLYNRENRYQLIMLPIIGVVIVLFLLVVSFSELSDFNAVFTIAMNILFYYTVFYLLHQPYMQFNLGLSSRVLVDNNYVGYILGSITEVGPDIILTSEAFNTTVGIDEIALHTVNLGGTTVMGMNASFANKIAIIPVPHDERLSVIMYAFRTHYQGISETQEQMTTPAVIAVIIPSVLLINMKNVLHTQQQITAYMEQYTNIEQLHDDQVIRNIVSRMLEELTF